MSIDEAFAAQYGPRKKLDFTKLENAVSDGKRAARELEDDRIAMLIQTAFHRGWVAGQAELKKEIEEEK